MEIITFMYEHWILTSWFLILVAGVITGNFNIIKIGK